MWSFPPCESVSVEFTNEKIEYKDSQTMNMEDVANTSDSLVLYNPYEKLVNVFLLCLEVVHVAELYRDFCVEVIDRNKLDITVIFDRILFDYIVVNWAKICGPNSETLHFVTVFTEAGYSADSVRNDFFKAIDLSYDEYKKMHTHLLTWRDKLIAHFDFAKAYDLTHNAEYFEKIQPQCKSIAESVIKAFDAAGEKNPEIECGIRYASLNFKLKKIAGILQRQLTDYPKDCSCAKWKHILQKLVEEQ